MIHPMTINYINRQLTDEEFFTKVFNKGKSKSSEKLTRAAINNLQLLYTRQISKNKERCFERSKGRIS